MKVKHIITTFGIILGGLLVAKGASAVVTYRTSSDLQFTWSGSLSLTLSEDDFVIESVAPGISAKSNAVTATVSTNSSAGYTLKATVGDSSTYTSAALKSSESTIAMIGDSATALSEGSWGLTLNDGTAYMSLPYNDPNTTVVPKTLNKTTDKAGTAATGYAGGLITTMKIGAYPAGSQLPGEYKNVINFAVTANVATRTISLAKGDGVASVVLGESGTSADYDEGATVAIAATCESGYSFNHWYNPTDYGVIASDTTASTTYTVGASDVTLTAYCKAD